MIIFFKTLPIVVGYTGSDWYARFLVQRQVSIEFVAEAFPRDRSGK